MIYPYEDIRAVHIEITDRCNAACPMCPRFIDGDEAPYIRNVHITLDKFKSMFPTEFLQQINRFNFCGNYGDPIVARDLLPILEYMRGVNEGIRIEVNTNASARRVDWWKSLAEIIGSDERMGGVWFGLDGLADTNHLYRRNTDWETIMRNAQAYIDAGGVAHWNFIAFKHNEHQIEEARTLAGEMGFKHFNIKLTARFHTDDTFPVISKGEHIYDLEPPAQEDHRRPEAVNHNQPKPSVPKMSDAMLGALKVVEQYKKEGIVEAQKPISIAPPKPNIKCVAQGEASIYVSATGYVYPCCWIGIGHFANDHDIIIDYNKIDITKRSIQEIVNGEEFQMVEDSWNLGSISKCVNICSVAESNNKEQTQYGSEYVIHRRADEK